MNKAFNTFLRTKHLKFIDGLTEVHLLRNHYAIMLGNPLKGL